MNFIQSLQAENKAQAREIAAYKDGLCDLLAYVTSPKFYLEPHVSVQDIILRVREIQSFATHKRENEDWFSFQFSFDRAK